MLPLLEESINALIVQPADAEAAPAAGRFPSRQAAPPYALVAQLGQLALEIPDKLLLAGPLAAFVLPDASRTLILL